MYWKAPGIAGVLAGEINGASIKRAARSGADLTEVRVDTFRERDPDTLAEGLKRLRSKANLPVILTVRSRKEGGKYAIGDKERLELFKNLMPFADIADIELSSGGIIKNVVDSAKGHGKKVIISYHNFKTTPGDRILQEIVRKARAKGGDIVKIAAFARGPQDLRRLARILTDSKDLIVIAMGKAGSASRVLFPAIGSLITYGSLTDKTAPGQMSVKELKTEFRRYGL
ncbi:MAG: type I 3-dehydroquinate dehydratase [Deltaproteobacteria bacterium]|nr:type I 3-dehydroquinate dehydratase [Deltaproteobacteria bacterium]